MLRPTRGDPWGVEQHHWNTGAEENQQLNPVGQATDKRLKIDFKRDSGVTKEPYRKSGSHPKVDIFH